MNVFILIVNPLENPVKDAFAAKQELAQGKRRTRLPSGLWRQAFKA
jgi:hypothetical protein